MLRQIFAATCTCLCMLIVSTQLSADWRDDIGWTQLRAEVGSALEDGTGITIMQAEAPNNDGRYMPDTSLSVFSGKTFTDASGTSTGSLGHASSVGRNFYGNTTSIAPGITDITIYDANDYLNRVLGFASGADPLAQNFNIGNHSYIANGLSDAVATNLSQRFDWVINQNEILMAVGVNNSSSAITPDLLAHSYNAIAVGRSDGGHSRGPSRFYGSGRFKPDIVAPGINEINNGQGTSYSTPKVASAAAILHEAGAGTNATRVQATRAILFAGATKDEFPNWSRTETSPIDQVFGFGELNIYNSYHILQGGEFDGVTGTPSSLVDHYGWDYGNFDGSNDVFYDFEIAAGMTAEQVSIALTWNIDVIDNNASPDIFDPTTNLADLDLALFLVDGGLNLLDQSISSVDNLEHIYAMDLAAGLYRFRISGDSAADFGLAWRITSIPEPVSPALFGLICIGVAFYRRKAV